MNRKLKLGLAWAGAAALHLGLLVLGVPMVPGVEPKTPAPRPARVTVMMASKLPQARVAPSIVRPPESQPSRAVTEALPAPVAVPSVPEVPGPPVAPAPQEQEGSGASAPPASQGLSPEAYLASVRQGIADHRSYPYQARVRRESGTVVVEFSLSPEGFLQGAVEVLASSGFPRLDSAARAAVASAAPFGPPPPAVANSRVTLPIVYVLE